MLNQLSTNDWLTQSTDFGALLVSFVVQQLMCQAGWVDNDQVEVDLVIEQGRKVWAVEIKRAASLHEKDGFGLARLASQAGKNFQGGILLYSGGSCLPLNVDKCFAVPLDWLWR